MQIVQVLLPFLQIDFDRFRRLLGLANQARISPSAPDVGETTDMANDLSKLIRAFPSHTKGADSTR